MNIYIALYQFIRNDRRCVSPDEMDEDELRRELGILGLPTDGSRDTLIKRYMKPSTSNKITLY